MGRTQTVFFIYPLPEMDQVGPRFYPVLFILGQIYGRSLLLSTLISCSNLNPSFISFKSLCESFFAVGLDLDFRSMCNKRQLAALKGIYLQMHSGNMSLNGITTVNFELVTTKLGCNFQKQNFVEIILLNHTRS